MQMNSINFNGNWLKHLSREDKVNDYKRNYNPSAVSNIELIKHDLSDTAKKLERTNENQITIGLIKKGLATICKAQADLSLDKERKKSLERDCQLLDVAGNNIINNKVEQAKRQNSELKDWKTLDAYA